MMARARTLACGLGSAAAVAGCSAQVPQNHDLVPLWETASSAASDTFYTTDFAQRNASMASGMADHGVVAWIACAARTLTGPHGEMPSAPVHDDLGYSVPMAFACAPPVDSTPLYRLYENAPLTDHVYASSVAEFDAWRRLGYVFERIEGYVWKSPIAGSVALYRISRCAEDAVSCAAEHRYSISVDTRDTLAAVGWQVQGIAGYVFSGYDNADTLATFTGTINGVTGGGTSPTRIALRNVIAPKTELVLGGGDRHRVLGELSSNSTARPAGADRQRIVFSLYTGDLFVATTTPLDHIPIWLYGHAQIASDGQGGVPYDGLGLFFSLPQWGNNRCASEFSTGGQIFVEEMAKAKVDCAANLVRPLQPDRWYDIVLTVTDRAKLSYTIKDRVSGHVFSFSKNYAADYACPIDHAPGSLALTKLYCNNPFSFDRFPAQRTGYFIWPIFRGTSATSGRLADIDVQWLDSNARVLSGK